MYAQPLAQLARAPRRRAWPVQLGGAHQPAAPAISARRSTRVDEEDPAGVPAAAMSSAGQGRADEPGAVEGRRVEADRVGQVRAPTISTTNDCRDRRVERARPRRAARRAGRRARARRRRWRRAGRARAASTPISAWVTSSSVRLSYRSASTPPYMQQQQGGAELQRGDEAERDAGVVGELQDQPVLADPLHPGAGERDQVGRGVQPVVADAQRAEHARPRRGPQAVRPSRVSRSVQVTHWPACP